MPLVKSLLNYDPPVVQIHVIVYDPPVVQIHVIVYSTTGGSNRPPSLLPKFSNHTAAEHEYSYHTLFSNAEKKKGKKCPWIFHRRRKRGGGGGGGGGPGGQAPQ